jgi:flavin-dependent dehydrogenase
VEFDADLVAQARDHGAVVVEEFAADAMVAAPGGFQLSAGDRQILARAVIFCGGVGGIGRRLLGLPAGRKAQLRQVDVSRSQGAAPDLRFDLEPTGADLRGYYWEFPSLLDGTACWNCGIYQPPSAVAANDLGAELRRALSAGGHALEDRPIRSYAARVIEPDTPLGRDGVLLAGEELGVEALAGEGISLAIWTGAVAGRVTGRALQTGRSPTPVRYARALREAPPWRSRLLMHVLASRLYGTESARYRGLALGSRRAASLLTDLISGRRSLSKVLLGLVGLYGYHRTLGLLRCSR